MDNDFRAKRSTYSENAQNGLPLRGKTIRVPRQIILASHLLFTGYAHWLPNDPRGSGSDEIRKDDLTDLGAIHHGRKRKQPARSELRKFYREAENRLDHETLWFDETHREILAGAFASALNQFGYTAYAFAILKNHAHGVIRSHRDGSDMIWNNLARATADALRASGKAPQNHPVWSHRPYKVFLYRDAQVSDRIKYVEDNPEKEGLARQVWNFVAPFKNV